MITLFTLVFCIDITLLFVDDSLTRYTLMLCGLGLRVSIVLHVFTMILQGAFK